VKEFGRMVMKLMAAARRTRTIELA